MKRKEARTGPLSIVLKNNTNPSLITFRCSGFVSCCNRTFGSARSLCRHIAHAHQQEIIEIDRIQIYDICRAISEIDARLLNQIIAWNQRGVILI